MHKPDNLVDGDAVLDCPDNQKRAAVPSVTQIVCAVHGFDNLVPHFFVMDNYSCVSALDDSLREASHRTNFACGCQMVITWSQLAGDKHLDEIATIDCDRLRSLFGLINAASISSIGADATTVPITAV